MADFFMGVEDDKIAAAHIFLDCNSVLPIACGRPVPS
jgi:hypothetical protein